MEGFNADSMWKRPYICNMNKAITIGGFIVLGAILFFAHGCIKRQHIAEVNKLKEEIFARDTMVLHADSIASILVRDNKTLKQLTDSLNNTIKSYLANRPLKPEVVTEIVFVPKEKHDTIYVGDNKEIITYYPDENDWVIKHRLQTMDEGYFYNDWAFNKIGIDLVISETESGLYEAAVFGPEFVQIKKLEVNALPRTQIDTERRKGLTVGAGAQFDWKSRRGFPVASVGYNWNKHYVMAMGWHSGAGLHYMRRL
jgi:hypothetical protein